MSDNAGWHPDAAEPNLTRYWDGAQWTLERRWDGTAWNDTTTETTPAIPHPVVPAGSTTGFVMSPTSWLLFGGAALAGIGALLPWEEVSSSFGVGGSASPSSIGGAAFTLFGLVALVIWVGWPAREGTLSSGRLLGLGAVAALMAFFVIAKFNAIGDAQAELDAAGGGGVGLGGFEVSASVDPGLGLYLWSTGTVIVWVGIHRAWRARRAVPLTATFP